jgi:phenylacetate-coenzyme A ligase PaaK-like adenylate-forming protein
VACHRSIGRTQQMSHCSVTHNLGYSNCMQFKLSLHEGRTRFWINLLYCVHVYIQPLNVVNKMKPTAGRKSFLSSYPQVRIYPNNLDETLFGTGTHAQKFFHEFNMISYRCYELSAVRAWTADSSCLQKQRSTQSTAHSHSTIKCNLSVTITKKFSLKMTQQGRNM